MKEAVKNVSFSLEKGEVVGYIGPNGAGKSTTLKMLSGVLIPTSGTVNVGGIVPYKERKENAKRIGVVFGQRSQLYWDLPISDTFDLYENLYSVPKAQFRRNCEYYIDLLDMKVGYERFCGSACAPAEPGSENEVKHCHCLAP